VTIQTILHASDTHFGHSVRGELADQLVVEAHELKPDVTIISGDLTRRAWHSQFRDARAWLDRLPNPLLVIPGNHDTPLYNPWERFRHPLRRYKRYISEEIEPTYRSDDLLIVGLYSARGRLSDRGWLTEDQLLRAESQIATRSAAQTVVLVLHHHFFRLPRYPQGPILDGERLLETFAQWGVDLVLVGHSHRAYVHQTERGVIVVQAGTATSPRGKGWDRGRNSYFIITVAGDQIEVMRRQYDDRTGRFEPELAGRFTRLTPLAAPEHEQSYTAAPADVHSIFT
jgi:3',5'-cyclic AMP phosphodiesterase CpdA